MESSHRSWFSYNYERLLKNSTSTILGSSDIWSKLERRKGLSGSLMSWPKIKKNCHFEVLSSFILHNNLWTIVQLDRDIWQKKDFIWWPALWLDWEAPSTSQSQTCSKGPGHCLVVWCRSDLLQLSESQRNHYIWEVCSANQWDALKTANQHWSTTIWTQFFSQQCPTTHCTTKVSKVEWIGSHTKFCLICRVHLTFHQLITSSNISTTFCRKKASTTSRRQKMLSKNLLKSEAQFSYCRNKLISHW